MSSSNQPKPIVAVVGRPNVGKSSLFNRILSRARSIVADQPGVTRDRIYADAVISGPIEDREIVLVDTGGFDPGAEDPIMRRVLEQTQLAIDEADAIVFLADGRVGVMPEDHDVARLLRRSGKPVVLGVNKLDGPSADGLLHEFYQLGIEEIYPMSAAHGRNVGELEEAVYAHLPQEPEVEFSDEELSGEIDESEPTGPIKVAVIGRPNAGKSSLINRLLGEDRHLVSEVAGTTVDSIDSLVEYQNEQYLFVDTAGIRRKRSIAMRVEKYSVVAALKGLERSDVALLMLDASQTIANQDAKVAAFAYEKGKAVILVVSKWDLEDKPTKDFTDKLRQELPHLAYAPIVYTSSHTGQGLDRLMPTIRKVYREYGHRVQTSELNKFVDRIMIDRPPPSKKGKAGRIYYVTQIDVRPPRFLVSVNKPDLIHFSYRRFLINELRKAYGYNGVPLLVGYRSHKKIEFVNTRGEKGAVKAQTSGAKKATAAKRARKAQKQANQSRARKRGPKQPRKTSIKRLAD